MPVQDNRPSETNTSVSSKGDFVETTINGVEPSTLDFVQNEFNAFEKRLLCGYSTLDTLPETELKLPMLLIDNFSRIFRLWQENTVFKNSIPSKTFYEIFSLMFRSLNNETTSDEHTENSEDDGYLSNLTGICETCDEEFEIIENDAKKSYAEHERSETHIKFLNDVNKIGTLDKKNDFKQMEFTVARTLPSINSTKKFSNMFITNEYFLESRNEDTLDIECHLCDIVFTKQSDLVNHCNSKIHKKHVLYFFRKPQSSFRKQVGFNDDLIYTKGNLIYCVLCECVQPKQNRNQHITEAYHKSWKNFARMILNLEEPYLHVINQKSKIAFCALCCTKFAYKYGIVQHCKTRNHIMYKHFADVILNGTSIKKRICH